MILLIGLLLSGLIIIFVVWQLFYNLKEINIVCDDDQFRDIIENVLACLDISVRHHLKNISIVLLEKPYPLESEGKLLLGMWRKLYFGMESIELYKNNILIFANKPGNSLQQCVRGVLLHEIGHHFAFSHEKLKSLGL